MKEKYIEIYIAEQMQPNQNHLLTNLEGSIFAWFFTASIVTLATVLMLLWPLMNFDGWWMMDD